jgi:DNA-binding NarL/FixJ family response regulator
MTPTSVAIVEDDSFLRAALARLISTTDDLRCVGMWPNAEEAIAELPAKKPDVVLMDINLPQASGITCTMRLKQKLPALQILMLTVYEDTDSIFRALKAGATGYLLKRSDPEEIVEAIRDIRGGGAPMTSEIARKVVHSFREPSAEGKGEPLSPREEEILAMLSRGFLIKEIADRTSVSVNTVKTHLQHIYQKLHVRSRTEAVVKFLA